jgi:pyrroloquinoline-quinone synthase
VLSNALTSAGVRGWVQRILDHDGFELGGIRDEGGIEARLRLAEAKPARRAPRCWICAMWRCSATCFAVDAYNNFKYRRGPWQEAVRSLADRAVRPRDPQAAAYHPASSITAGSSRPPW